MKDYQNIIDQYERYLDGELDEVARMEMENTIANDKQLAELLNDHKLMLDGIRFSARKDLLAKLGEWDEAMTSLSNQWENEPKVRKLRWYYVAASVVLFALSVTFVYQYNANTYPRIASRHYSQYETTFSSTRGANTDNSLGAEIVQQYELGRYDAVIEMANDLGEAEMSEIVQFHLGCAFMANKRHDDAIEIFEGLSETSNGRQAASKWYMALAYLYKDDPDQALPILKDLADGRSYYSSKASNILDDLD
jgi:tetratricopeptide (TPR) repeat protein